jgi:TolA-binding protein
MSAMSKQGMRRNPLAEWIASAVRLVQGHRTPVLVTLLLLCLSVGAGAGYWWYRERLEDEAAHALAVASTALRGEQPGTPGNVDEATKRYREVTRQYRGTRSAEEALIALGNHQFRARKTDEALESFGEYMSIYPGGRFRVMAALGKAYGQEAKGNLQGAVQTLSEILERDKGDPLVGEVYMSLARMYEGLKQPDDAMRIYGQVAERFSQTQWAQHALQRMSALEMK